MTREKAKELLPIIQAWAKGKEIQFKACSGKWTDVEENEGLSFVYSSSDYRIKPEPKYRPFKNQEECWEEMHKHSNFGWISDGYYKSTISVKPNSIVMTISSDEYSFISAFQTLTFIDGTPFGIKKEQRMI